MQPLCQITWATPAGRLRAIEPEPDEVVRYAGALAAAYNDPRNAPLLGHTEDVDEDDVVAHYADVAEAGGHNFLVFLDPTGGSAPRLDGALAADADLRKVGGGAAEFAFMVASPAAQGKGLGTRVALMIHAFGFRRLELERVYASIIPGNAASRRVFEKLGYQVDASPAARAYADEPGDITMAIDRAGFERSHAQAMAEIEIAVR
ncbi:MAG TPA: GNAT family N-acetyltransferase [Kofleriaceae bacterium]